MNIFDVLYARNTGRIRPRAKITDNLLGLALAGGGYEEKTIDFTPVISISDAKAGNALDYQCKITAVQSGSGDTSPTNIRPISGFTGANISVNGSTVSVSWLSEAGTVYGGVLDVTTGTLTVDRAIYTFTGNETVYKQSNNKIAFPLPNQYRVTGSKNQLCTDFADCVTSGTWAYIGAYDMSEEDFKEYCRNGDVRMTVPLAEPITYTLTPTEITLAEGANTIWADCGDSKLTYLAKK